MEPFLSPDAVEQRNIEKKRAMAQALMQMRDDDDGRTQMVGNVAIKNSPFAGLAKILSSYYAGKLNHDADAASSALDEKRRQKTAEILQSGFSKMQSGDSYGAMQTFAQDPQTEPYARAIMSSSLKQQPVPSGDIALAREMGFDLSTPEGRNSFADYKRSLKPKSDQGDYYGNPIKTVDENQNIHVYLPGKSGDAKELTFGNQKVVAETPWDKRDNDANSKVKTQDQIGKNKQAEQFENEADKWEINKSFMVDSIPQIKEALASSPSSGVSSAVQQGFGKLIGNTPEADAQSIIRQYSTIFLQGVPYPPGSQTETELKQRASVLSDQLQDPSIGAKTKIKLISNFVDWQDKKAAKQREKASELRGKEPKPAEYPKKRLKYNPQTGELE